MRLRELLVLPAILTLIVLGITLTICCGCCGMGFIDDQTASSGERKVFYWGKPPPVDKAVVGREEEPE